MNDRLLPSICSNRILLSNEKKKRKKKKYRIHELFSHSLHYHSVSPNYLITIRLCGYLVCVMIHIRYINKITVTTTTKYSSPRMNLSDAKTAKNCERRRIYAEAYKAFEYVKTKHRAKPFYFGQPINQIEMK